MSKTSVCILYIQYDLIFAVITLINKFAISINTKTYIFRIQINYDPTLN